MPNKADQLGIDGKVEIPLSDYHKLVRQATERVKSKEVYAKRRRQIEASAREIEQFLTFLYKNTSLNMEEYVQAFNRKSKNSSLRIGEEDKRILVDLGGILNEQEEKET